MTWTYTGAPSSVSRDAVRLLSGQTSSSDDVLLTDGEIAYALAQKPSVEMAAAWSMEMMAARYSGFPASKSIGQLGITYGDRVAQLQASAKMLRRDAAISGFTPFVGGTSLADKLARESDTDRPAPAFLLGQFENTESTG